MKQNTVVSSILFLLVVLPLIVCGQGEEMLSRFSAVENSGRVDVVWTMRAGNICLGIDVERTTDTVNEPPQTIYSIPGECGDERVDVTFRHADLEPVEGRTSYYRLVLGAVPTTYREVNVPVYGEKELIFSPNPANNQTDVRFRNPNREQLTLELYSAGGELLLIHEGISDEHYLLQTNELPGGVYLVRLKSADNSRILSGKLIITK